MSNVWFCSDLHFGHKNIGGFRAPHHIQSEEENRWRITEDWRRLVRKNDVVYVLGDACFTMETIFEFEHLPGIKTLILGNHDNLATQEYLKHFKSVEGIVKYKEFWLTHAPIHPAELRGKVNLHGHVHYATIDDKRYFNCCPENLWRIFGESLVSLDQIRKHLSNENSNR